MTTKYRPDLIRIEIANCMRSDCPRSANCLRYLHYFHSAPFFQRAFIDPRTEVGDSCRHFLTAEVVRFARGFRRASLQIKHGDVATLQAEVRSQLGCGRTSYYNYLSGRSVLTPDEQAVVRRVFSDLGVTEGELFDSFEEGYLQPY